MIIYTYPFISIFYLIFKIFISIYYTYYTLDDKIEYEINLSDD